MLDENLTFLRGGGASADRITEVDWAATPLGPISSWPAVLRISISNMLNSSFPKCLCWGPEKTMIYNDAFVPILGNKHPCMGRPFLDAWGEAADMLKPIVEKAYSGESVYIEDFHIVTTRSGTPEDAYFTFCYSPLRDEHGNVCGMLDTVVETTSSVEARELSMLRNRELVHRARNVYALVSSLISQTFRSAASVEDAQDRIQKRIRALVAAQDVLVEAKTVNGSISDVARRSLAPFLLEDGPAIRIEGPDIGLGREQLTALSLALHELATNSVKYGALGDRKGYVDLRWQMEGNDFRLTWREADGPLVVKPGSRGFGSAIIQYALPEAFSGTVEVDYAPTGFTLSLTAPADRLRSDERTAEELLLPF